MSIDPRPARFARPSPAALLGFALVAAARLLTLPESLWEWDEILFVKGIESFDPLHHQPHPPGYPLLIGLGKLLNFFLHNPFVSLVTLNVACSLVGYAALVSAFRRLAASDRAAVTGALLFHLSPSMLVYGPLALSDSPALMFLSLALAAAARLPEGGIPAVVAGGALGVFASGAIGCRPQLALAVLPMTAVALVFARGPRPRLAALGAFTLTCLLWFVPLVVAVGGLGGFLPFLGKQAGLVVEFDTEHPRSGASALWVATRFLSHPWGPRWTALPVLALAAAGCVALVLRRQARALPLAVLAGIDLTLGLLVMNPFDAVRYALPSLLAVAFAAGVGCDALARRVRVPAAAWLATALLVTGFCVYTAPLLIARSTTPSPPVQAVEWAKREARYDAVFLVEDNLAAHASYLLPFQRVPVAQGLQRYALERTAPVYLLGNGESGWPHAKTFSWPDSDAYGKLSRGGLYRVVSISPLSLERRFDALRGIHAWEPTAREAGYRWMEDSAAIRLVLRKPRLRVRLRLHPMAPWPSNTVVIAVAGSPAATLEIRRGEEREAVVPLPSTGTADTVDVTFRSARSFVPAETGAGTDRRRLAVQLVDIEQVGS